MGHPDVESRGDRDGIWITGGMLDCQLSNPHLMRMGAREISRQEFEQRLAEGVSKTRPAGVWTKVFNPDPRWDPG